MLFLGGMETQTWDELTSSKSWLVHQCAHGRSSHLWVLVLFRHSCQLVLMLRTVWGLRCYFSSLQIGCDVCLMLRIVCEQCYWCIDNWFWHLSTIEDRWWAPWHSRWWVSFGHFANWFWCQLPLGMLHVGEVFGNLYQSPSERVCDWPVVWCVCVYSICVSGILLPYAKWEIQVQFIKKNFSHGIMTNKKRNFFFGQYIAKYSLDS